MFSDNGTSIATATAHQTVGFCRIKNKEKNILEKSQQEEVEEYAAAKNR